jgi:hypothetical protein
MIAADGEIDADGSLTHEVLLRDPGEVLGDAAIALPHVILLPAASPRMLPAASRDGSEAMYGDRPADRADRPLHGFLASRCSYMELL